MKGQQLLSPKKYIETKARTLPIYKCWVNPDWEEAGMANVIVARRHNNGHLTAGFYLVDLMCLGIKDTMYFFNETQERIEEILGLDQSVLTEIEYELAHNIIFAGHDFAAEYEIHPHKEFAITKFILEEDTEAIPVLEVPVGDEHGKPSLIVSSDYNYSSALEKLKKNAGEGNYTFIINDYDEEDLDYDEEDDFDEGDEWLGEIDNDFIDFDDVRAATDDELEEVLGSGLRTLSEEAIIHIEQMLRLLIEREPGWIPEVDEIVMSKDFKLYDSKVPLQLEAYNREEKLISRLFSEFEALPPGAEHETGEDSSWFKLFKKHGKQEFVAFAILTAMPLLITTTCLEYLRNNHKEYPPLIQLTVAGFSLALQQKTFESYFDFITQHAIVEDVFAGNLQLHSMHHKVFWAVKALHAMNNDNKKQIQYYHALLSLTGVGGKLKLAYATRFAEWLEKYIGNEG